MDLLLVSVTVLGVPQNHSILQVVQAVTCLNREHLDAFYTKICQERPTDKYADGVVIRDPAAWYYKANSFFIKKVKYCYSQIHCILFTHNIKWLTVCRLLTK
jgi:hypothetical protein